MAVFLAGCGGVTWDDQGAGAVGGTSGGTSSGSPSGGGGASGTGSGAGAGPAACPTGAHPASFGATSGATVGVVTAADGVYWTNSDGSVWKAAPGGGSPHAIAQVDAQDPWTMAVDGADLYVVDYGTALWHLSEGGGAPTMLAQGQIVGVAADADAVYFTDVHGIQRIGKAGGAPVMLAAIDDAESIALDDAWVYVKVVGNVSDLTARVVRAPKAGGAPQVVAESGSETLHYFDQELAVDGENVYWVAPSQGKVMSAPKAGGGAPVALASGIDGPASLTLDGANVYFTVVAGSADGSVGDRAVAKVSLAGGDVAFVAHGPQTSAWGIAVDATNAYWSEYVVTGPLNTACK